MRDHLTARQGPLKSLQSHIPALDGIRGLAIILVLIVHLTSSSHQPTHSSLLSGVIAFCNFGWSGVDLFFVLSGFLITGILYDTVSRPSFFRNFYARRFLRICPLYFGSLLVLFILSGPLGIGWHGGIQWHGSQFILFGYLQNFPPLRAFIPASVHQYTGHFWSLAVEEQFYLVWPCLVFFIRDRKKLIIAAMALAAVAPILRTAVLLTPSLNRDLWCYEFTLCRMDSLLIGGALALAMRGPARSWLLRFSPAVFLSLFFACFGIDYWLTKGNNLWAGQSNFFFSVGFTILAVSFAALIGCALRTASLAEHIFQLTFLRWFGRYSYGIYVLHFMILQVYAIGTWPRNFVEAKFHSELLCLALGGVPTLGVTLVLAWLSFRFYECRFLHLKRYFDVRRRSIPPKSIEVPGPVEATYQRYGTQ